MAKVVRDRGSNGHGAIKFRQNLEYPRVPGEITYYPPEPSDELKAQVTKERAGGLIAYIIGFAIVLMGYIGANHFSDSLEVYSTLAPILIILGLVFACLFLYLNSTVWAKLARAMPLILMICMVLLYIASIITALTGMTDIDENNIEDMLDDLILSLLNPAFFLITAGLMICHAGGTMLLMSTKIYNEFIPGMIIIESPGIVQAPAPVQPSQPPLSMQTPEAPVCQHCGKPMEYIGEYNRHYCYDCKEYAPAAKQ